jgi:hypothetical protein
MPVGCSRKSQWPRAGFETKVEEFKKSLREHRIDKHLALKEMAPGKQDGNLRSLILQEEDLAMSKQAALGL